MITPSALAAYCYDSEGQKIQARIDWLVQQRDALTVATFGTGGAATSIINAGENGKLAGFEVDLTGSEALQVVTDALELMGVTPPALQIVRTTHASFENLVR